MSTLNVEGIKNTAATSDTITLATDGTCTAKASNLPVYNWMINGSMQIAQRGTASSASGYQTVDRFAVDASGEDETPSQAQVDVTAGTTPYTLGFRKALKITNGNQTGGAGASDYVRIRHVFEAQNIANSGWNFKSSSSYITLAFWVKSSVAQNFYGFFRNSDGTMYQYPFETGALSANTWTKVTKIIPGNSNITMNNVNTAGLEFYFHPFQGTAETASGVALNTWTTYSGTAKMPDNTSTWWTTNDATFEVTGFQLTVTDYCPDYPHMSYADELLRCQRYYEVIRMSTGTAMFHASGNSTIGFSNHWWYKVEKRIGTPTISLVNGATFKDDSNNNRTLTGMFTSPDHVMFYNANSNGGSFRLFNTNQVISVTSNAEL